MHTYKHRTATMHQSALFHPLLHSLMALFWIEEQRTTRENRRRRGWMLLLPFGSFESNAWQNLLYSMDCCHVKPCNIYVCVSVQRERQNFKLDRTRRTPSAALDQIIASRHIPQERKAECTHSPLPCPVVQQAILAAARRHQ